MMELIADGESFRETFMGLCAEANRNILLCSPYVKESITKDIIANKKRDSEIELITAILMGSFRRRSSDLSAISHLLESGCRIYNCNGVHAKFYIFDNEKCIITSANLTEGGLGKNHEAGVITNDRETLRAATKYYQTLKTDETSGFVRMHAVAEIEGMLSRLPPYVEEKMPVPDTLFPNEIEAICEGFSGWRLDVFNETDKLPVPEFDSESVAMMSERLRAKYPRNNNREAKVRQQLQELRDLGLIQFVRPGVYRRLWR